MSRMLTGTTKQWFFKHVDKIQWL